MQRTKMTAAAAAAVAFAAVLAGCASGDEAASDAEAPAQTQSAAPEPQESEMADPEPMADVEQEAAGGYVAYADYQADPAGYAAGGDVVLFFNASWCPTCVAADGNFSESSFPAGLTVVSIDYDDNTDLRQQYGVTVQHTFVQVDAAGNEVAKWTGSSTVDQVADQVA